MEEEGKRDILDSVGNVNSAVRMGGMGRGPKTHTTPTTTVVLSVPRNEKNI